ncbi:MAG: hypothetical protein WCR21_11335 [Bacteroidota bacterium]
MKTKKIKVSIALTLLLLLTITLAMCKKDKQQQVPDNLNKSSTGASSTSEKNLVPVKSPQLNLSSKQILDKIKAFKTGADKSIKGRNITELENMQLEEAQFLMEASLNYDFDDLPTDLMVPVYDVTEYGFTFNQNNSEITGEDVNALYNTINEYCAGLVDSPTIIAAIDVQFYIYDPGTNEGIIKVTALKLQASGSGCNYTSAFNTGITDYRLTAAGVITSNLGLSCTFPNNSSSLEADYKFEGRINCQAYNVTGGCGSGGSYFPVVNPFALSAQNNPSELPWITIQPRANFCSGVNVSSINNFDGSQMNTYLSNFHTYITNNIPSGELLVGNSVHIITDFNFPTSNSPHNCNYYWKSTWLTGILQCRSSDPG